MILNHYASNYYYLHSKSNFTSCFNEPLYRCIYKIPTSLKIFGYNKIIELRHTHFEL